MSWTAEGDWLVERPEPWTAENDWAVAVAAGARLRMAQRVNRRPDLTCCERCGDTGFVSHSEIDPGSRVAVFCPVCRPEQFRAQMEGAFEWSSSVRGSPRAS